MQCALALVAGVLIQGQAHANVFPYNAVTAPDQPSRQALLNPLTRITQGAPAGADPSTTVHKNLPQLIEQNLAMRSVQGATAVIDNLTDKELGDLAHFYTQALNDTGHRGLLLPILAYRLDGVRLGRLSKHFGYAPVYAAVVQFTPEKIEAFNANSSPSYMGSGGVSTYAGAGQFLNYTLYEIYLSFRTAPVGALGVTGALYETGATIAQPLGWAFLAGTTAGIATGSLIQTYNPPLWDAIGGTVAGMVDNITKAGSQLLQGDAEKAAGSLFGLSFDVSNAQSSYGGDYGASASWEFEASQGSPGTGGGSCYNNCPRPTNDY